MLRKLVLGALVLGASLMPSAVHAQTTLATAYPSVLGQGRLFAISASSQIYQRVQLQAGRSYFAVCWGVFSTTQSAICGVDIRNGSDVSVGSALNVEPFDSTFTIFGGDGDSYQPTTSGSYYIRTSNFVASAQSINVIVIETTLFSPWWFVSPGSGYDSYVEIRNNTAESVPVTVRAYGGGGNLAGSTTQTVAANGTLLVLGSSLVPGGGSGSMSIAFDGPPGSITANTTTLSAITGLSFDAPFTPRMNWSSFGYLQ